MLASLQNGVLTMKITNKFNLPEPILIADRCLRERAMAKETNR